MPFPNPNSWDFDIDRTLNHIVPPPPWRHIPYPIAHFFGYRRAKPKDYGSFIPIFWAFIGIFCGVAIIELVSYQIPSFRDHGAPIIVGSFGAAAVLEFYSIDSPLAQPRNSILGQLIAAIVGVGICKLFALSPDFESIRWIGGALACAAATVVMALTKTIHPPAGATALLAVVDDEVVKLGWFLIPIVLLGCLLMLSTALLINNIQRQFPTYWWTPLDLHRRRRESDTESKAGRLVDEPDGREGVIIDRAPTHQTQLLITRGAVTVPEHMYLTQEEKTLLESLSNRL